MFQHMHGITGGQATRNDQAAIDQALQVTHGSGTEQQIGQCHGTIAQGLPDLFLALCQTGLASIKRSLAHGKLTAIGDHLIGR